MTLIGAALLLQPANVSSDKTPQEQYIEKYAPIAVSEMHRSGVPASITLAQGLLESGSGMSTLAVKGNNHFGIKCHKDWKGRRIYHDDDARGECFRAYDNAAESFRDHSDYLRYYDRYKSLFSIRHGDYKAWAHGLKAAGYATDPAYASKVISYIEKYNLDRFDSMDANGVAAEMATVAGSMPEAPLKLEEARKVEKPALRAGVSETVGVSFSRLFTKNGVECVFALEGETYRDIASAYGLSLFKLLSINELKADEELLPGTVVYISPKKNKAAKGLDKYVFGDNPESLREISQRFGVKLSAIMKMNGLSADWQASEGDTIILRK